MEARQRGGIVAARLVLHGSGRKSNAIELHGICSGFGRGPLDDSGRARRSRACIDSDGLAVHSFPVAAGEYIRRKDAFRNAIQIRGPYRAANRRLTGRGYGEPDYDRGAGALRRPVHPRYLWRIRRSYETKAAARAL